MTTAEDRMNEYRNEYMDVRWDALTAARKALDEANRTAWKASIGGLTAEAAKAYAAADKLEEVIAMLKELAMQEVQ